MPKKKENEETEGMQQPTELSPQEALNVLGNTINKACKQGGFEMPEIVNAFAALNIVGAVIEQNQ